MPALISSPVKKTHTDRVRDGMWGLLVADACGVPYEFRHPKDIPPFEEINMHPPKGYLRSYAHVPLGTWSDDSAQALCLYASLKECGMYHAYDFTARLIKWHDRGYMAVDNYVFDIGNQTTSAIAKLKKGMTARYAGLRGERNNGNGSLMRCLPLALLHGGKDVSLVMDAHAQSEVTHAHLRSQVCCALYCLWARRELQNAPDPWNSAVSSLRNIYQKDPAYVRELETHIRPDEPPHGQGTGYVLDTLHSARLACEEKDYASVIRRAIALGHDTDTTACVAGGIAGIRHGIENIPTKWRNALRGAEILNQLDLSQAEKRSHTSKPLKTNKSCQKKT
ncbi:ADP-ribosylglycohydrolase family protein [Coraliomargarita sp. SDUM461003]|uniref:ADP-ribosylglycohydrolase family protein n=1 Tax=Thalassobacterium maritimum TaxID=3041265 RepID=A0ABU1AYF9_9BACT|nr:ADP-ribosylglycohydrolase family protein [Coraliomargarita sp. SDUM461003]MDQ8209121.1 ADP-ribosylglycohydrolase family protein [Coraliomargarita sp. SDUM461003]